MGMWIQRMRMDPVLLGMWNQRVGMDLFYWEAGGSGISRRGWEWIRIYLECGAGGSNVLEECGDRSRFLGILELNPPESGGIHRVLEFFWNGSPEGRLWNSTKDLQGLGIHPRVWNSSGTGDLPKLWMGMRFFPGCHSQSGIPYLIQDPIPSVGSHS